MRALRERMEKELGKETPGRLHVKFGRGGLVDVEFITQALQMTPRRRGIRRSASPHTRDRAPRDRPRPASCPRTRRRRSPGTTASSAASRADLRLFGARPADTLEPAGPIPARLAKSLDYPSRKDFLEDYQRRTAWVRALYDRVVPRRGMTAA